MSPEPIVVIGAPRTGTNMLRDALGRLPGVATWPCDEINYIWRYGNVRYPSDEFPPELARPGVRAYIRRQFDWVAHRYSAEVVVEKTCANSLRVPFVDRVIPEARYLFIRRDGLDAVASAIKRWTASLDPLYLIRKARFVPRKDLPYYALRYLRSRAYRLVSRERRVASWGPRFEGMDQLLPGRPLEEICALQWKLCTEAAAAAFASMPRDRWLEVPYEDFVHSPEDELARITDFLGLGIGAGSRRRAVADVRASSVGKGRAGLSEETVQGLEPLIGETMARLGYA